MKLFSGTSNPALSQEVANLLDISLAKCEITRFDNSEVRVRIEENVKDEVCIFIQPTSNPTDTHLMELFFFADAARRGEAKKTIAVVPYFGYARQNIQHRSGECVSTNVVINFLENIGFDEVHSFDFHDEGTTGIFKIPFFNLTGFNLLAGEIKKYLSEKNISESDVVIATPDQGGVERARKFGEYFYGHSNFDNVLIEKSRDQNIIHTSTAVALYGDVANKTVIIVDDIMTSGGTLFNAANLCLEKGARNVLAAIAHHDFSPNIKNKIEESKIEKIFTTNTIELKEENKSEKIIEISVAREIAKNLQ